MQDPRPMRQDQEPWTGRWWLDYVLWIGAMVVFWTLVFWFNVAN
jgi:hypothetical protein